MRNLLTVLSWKSMWKCICYICNHITCLHSINIIPRFSFHLIFLLWGYGTPLHVGRGLKGVNKDWLGREATSLLHFKLLWERSAVTVQFFRSFVQYMKQIQKKNGNLFKVLTNKYTALEYNRQMVHIYWCIFVVKS